MAANTIAVPRMTSTSRGRLLLADPGLLIGENPFGIETLDREKGVDLVGVERIDLARGTASEDDRIHFAEVRLEVWVIGDPVHKRVTALGVGKILGLHSQHDLFHRASLLRGGAPAAS